MAYVTADDVRLALRPITPDTAAQVPDSPASLSTEQINDAIAQAGAKVDAYLGGRYDVPVAVVDPEADTPAYPAPVPQWTRDIAAWLCMLTWSRNRPVDPNDPVRLRYLDTMSDLSAVQRGLMTLVLPADVPTVASEGYTGVINPYDGDLFDSLDYGNRPTGLHTAGGATWIGPSYGW